MDLLELICKFLVKHKPRVDACDLYLNPNQYEKHNENRAKKIREKGEKSIRDECFGSPK